MPVTPSSGQNSAMMTPVAESEPYPASFARAMPAGQVGSTAGEPMPRRKVKEIQNWRQSQVLSAEQAEAALKGEGFGES